LALMQDILNWDPTNQDVSTWVTNYPDNNATVAEEQASVALLQTGQYNLTSAQLAEYDADLQAINPELPQYFTNDGIVTDPNYVDYANQLEAGTLSSSSWTFDPEYGGYNPNLLGSDLLTLLTNNQWNFSSLENVNTVGFLLDPAQGDPGLSAAAAVPASAAMVSNLANLPSLSTDLTALLASFGTTAGADAVSAALAELSAQFTADLATVVPQSLLGLF
jgi:hypothetical protein